MFPADPGAAPEQPVSRRPRHPRRATPTATRRAGLGRRFGQQVAASRRRPRQAPPTVSLPKGGGAIRDIGEKFSVSAATGTASLAVPVATSPGRAGFGPPLSLDYDSGAGNGAFGLGWKMSLPAITRKTDKGLPRYHDDPDQDTFILSGAEDLVPVRAERNGAGSRYPSSGRSAAGGSSPRYRPRIEGLFARIERWRELARARRTGGRSPRATSRRSMAPRPRAASRTRPTRRGCSAG